MFKNCIALVFVFSSLIACKQEVGPCEDITCLNGGQCDDGKCNCPEGYTSFNCSDQVEPTRIFVSEVNVTSWPEDRINGDPWDSDSNPDISWELTNEQNQLVLSSDSVYQDAASGENLAQSIQPPLTVVNVSSQGYFFKLSDEDAGNFKETMDLAGFRFYQEFNSFPDILNVETENGLSVEFSLSYEWD